MVDLHNLAGKGNVEGVRKFLQKHAAKVNTTNREGQTALHCAAKGGHVEVCQELIASVANVEVADAKHRTALRIAVEHNKPRVARVLCEAGASTSIPDPVDMRTPLHLAANKGFVDCADILLQHGAIIDGNPDKWGRLPDEDCATSDIRILIETARRDRAANVRRSYSPQAASAPPSSGEYEGEASPAYFQQPYQEEKKGHDSTGLSQSAPPEREGEYKKSPASPLAQARNAAKVGGERCAGCNAPERSRQLTPCHHVVCGSCARRARDEEEDGCPVCRCKVFDDNPLFM